MVHSVTPTHLFESFHPKRRGGGGPPFVVQSWKNGDGGPVVPVDHLERLHGWNESPNREPSDERGLTDRQRGSTDRRGQFHLKRRGSTDDGRLDPRRWSVSGGSPPSVRSARRQADRYRPVTGEVSSSPPLRSLLRRVCPLFFALRLERRGSGAIQSEPSPSPARSPSGRGAP